MAKSLFEDELIAGMEGQLRKQATGEKPSLAKAANCLHAALEILEEQGLTARADQVLKLLQKIAQTNEARDVMQMPTKEALVRAGLKEEDLIEFAKGSPIAKAKFNLVLRRLGYSDHQIGNIIGKTNVMSEDDAIEILNPNRSFSKIHDWLKNPTQPVDPRNPQPGETISLTRLPVTGPGDVISFQSMKEKSPPGKDDLVFNSLAYKKPSSDRHTKGLTPEKMLKNLETHGTPFNLADDMPPTLDMNNLKESDFDPEFAEFAEILKEDNSDSDDELFNMEITDDSLEVSENEVPIEDFEDERD